MDPKPGDDIVQAAIKVLLTGTASGKADRTEAIVRLWEAGSITLPVAGRSYTVPDRPARDGDVAVKLVGTNNVPKRGRGGSLRSRQAILHALVHIESSAVDLAWDIIARFGAADAGYQLPADFFSDFIAVASDECRHYRLLEQRLEETGSHYGALPAHDVNHIAGLLQDSWCASAPMHRIACLCRCRCLIAIHLPSDCLPLQGLWEAAVDTAGSLAARLAVEHCTHEARGLDVLPSTIAKFRLNGDTASADLLEHVVYPEEISHCAAGVRWLKHLHSVAHNHDWGQVQQAQRGHEEGGQQQQQQQQLEAVDQQTGLKQQQQQQQQQEAVNQQSVSQQQQASVAAGAVIPPWAAEARGFPSVKLWFHALIRRHFHGLFKPPFNDEARAQAGFGPEWYLPLTVPASPPAASNGES
ncbi:hypothetical protein ACK3TF_001468 [Chlorella vulgaris]